MMRLFNRKKQIEDSLDMLDSAYKGRTMSQEIWMRFRRNKGAMVGLFILGALVLISIGTLVLDYATDSAFYKAHVVMQNLPNKLQAPSWEHIFGCDEYGQDIFVRMIWGTRYSLFLGLASMVFALLAGGIIGAIAGYLGGIVDNVFMRIMDVLLAIPFILLAIALVSALGTSTMNLILAIGIPEIPGFARIVRASVMMAKDKDFVEAARASGGGNFRILMKYILPNCLSPVIVRFSLSVATSILNIAGLSFIGLGVQPPIPEWGAMLSSARNYIRDAWHITVIPGLGIMTAVLALNMFGDGMRDALDPNMKR